MEKLTPSARAFLAFAGDYREFLKIYFRETGIAYAEVARRGGFSSRSYPRDVTEGRRRLTARSLPSLLRGLRLEADLSKVFQLLYFTEHPEEHPETLSPSSIGARLERDRKRAARSLRGPVRAKASLPDLSGISAGLTDVIAALGAVEDGATLEEIQQRTGLSKTTLARTLEALVREGVASYRGDSSRYFPGTGHLDWTGQGGSRLAQAMFQSSVERLARVAERHFGRDDALLLSSAVSISKRDLPRFKRELRELILRFVDRSVDSSPAPDTVAQIVTGLFEGRLVPPTGS